MLVVAAAISALSCLPSALANDTTASFALGGLVPLKQSDVAMESEVLRVTSDRVEVDYVFRNLSDKDVDATVAFPLPKFNHQFFFYENSPWANEKSGNLVNFAVTVDGVAIPTQSRTRAYLKDADVTQRLRDMGVPLGTGILPKYPAELNAKLIAAKLMMNDGEQDVALWDEQTTFYWPQKFPASSAIRVGHRYAPATGYEHFSGEGHNTLASLCISDADAAEFRRLAEADKKRAPEENGYIAELATVDYILTTARNWRGPIRDFELTITTDRPHTMVASCYPGLTRTGPNTLTLHRRDFSPPEELRVYFVELHRDLKS